MTNLIENFENFKDDNSKVNEYWEYSNSSSKAIINAKIDKGFGDLKDIEISVKLKFSGNEKDLLDRIGEAIIEAI